MSAAAAQLSSPELDVENIGYCPPALNKWKALLGGRATLTMANFTDRYAAAWGPRTCFVLDKPIDTPYFSSGSISYADLNRLVKRAASMLQSLGVKKGDRVALATLNRIELAFVEFGAQRLGAVPVPINFMLTKDEMKHLVERSGARVMVTDRGVLQRTIKDPANIPTIEQWVVVTSQDVPEGCHVYDQLMEQATEDVDPVACEPDDPAIIFFTAGTTGLPKGATLTHGGLVHSFARYLKIAALGRTPTKHLALVPMPLAHTGGHQALLVQLALARPMIVLGQFNPARVLDYIERYRVTMLAGIPTMYRMLLAAGAEKRDLTSVKLWGGGGDAFPHDLVDTLRGLTETSFGPWRRRAGFITGYGMAEAAGQVSITPPFPAGDGCVGWLLPGVKWRLVDKEGRDVPRGEVGELWIKTAGVMREYWEDPEGTAKAMEDGWLKTGDLMKRGKYGMFYFVSREKEMIKVGGFSVFPAEIEKELEAHEAVEKAVVVGLPHDIKGELPVAAIIKKRGTAISEEELQAWSDDHVANYRAPRKIVFIDSVPQNFSMKPLRNKLRQQLIDQGIKVQTRAERREATA